MLAPKHTANENGLTNIGHLYMYINIDSASISNTETFQSLFPDLKA